MSTHSCTLTFYLKNCSCRNLPSWGMKHHPALILPHYPPWFFSINYLNKHKLRRTTAVSVSLVMYHWFTTYYYDYCNWTDQLMGFQLKYARTLTPLSESHGVKICAGTATSVQSRRYPNTAVATLNRTLESPPRHLYAYTTFRTCYFGVRSCFHEDVRILFLCCLKVNSNGTPSL